MNEALTHYRAGSVGELFAEPSFLLATLEVFNWGPFHGKHSCEIDPQGSAIIGPTGSGKTTLIDALMTLLARQPRYNLASTGGHESDRDLISYIRGVSGAESAAGENDHMARPGKTITGLCARYVGGHEVVSIGAIFWVDGSSNAADDLKKLWFFAKDIGQPLDLLLRLHHEGGKAAITRYGRDTVGLQLYGSSKKDYLAKVREFFDVSENAFALLNRAAGLKQINSIDQIFRELVLDDRSAFKRAEQVVTEFDTLQDTYTELETARRQRDALLPVQAQHRVLEEVIIKLGHLQHLKLLLPTWFAKIAVDLWASEVGRISELVGGAETALRSEEEETARSQSLVDALKEKYLRLGGANIQELEGNIATTQRLVEIIRKKARDYQQIVRLLSLSDTLDEATFRSNSVLIPEHKAVATEEFNKSHEAVLSVESSFRDAKLKVEALEDEARLVAAKPHSNIPAKHHAFREELAAYLALAPEQVPFVAELVEVKPTEVRWRGAIERAIGSERLRILVPVESESDAISWINARDNKLDVRIQRVEPYGHTAQFYDDGFTRKLNYRNHPFRETVKHLLSRHDLHCVETTEELRRTEFGITPEGTMSGRGGRFEKKDSRPLNEGWMTGFDNLDQLRFLTQQILETQAISKRLESDSKLRRSLAEGLRQQLTIIEQVEALQFHDVDLPKAEGALNALKQRLSALTQPDSDAARAKHDHEIAVVELEESRTRAGELRERLGGFRAGLQDAEAEQLKAKERRGEGLSEQDVGLAALEFPISETLTAKQVGDAERAASAKTAERIELVTQQKSLAERNLIRAMALAKHEDTWALSESGTELRDVSDYLKRLKTLEDEALPGKLKRFLDYLNHSSGQGVTQLLEHVDSEVSLIEDRVASLNATLSRVDFRDGQYLQLRADRIVHDSIRQMDAAQRKLRVAALRPDDDQGAAHYKALGEVIRLIREAQENRRTLAAQALLDPRHRLQFFVVEVDRASGQASGRRTGSQTGSGGEKEMMASYILTASLSYALCPPGATLPRYATIVLDEAFSKSSPAAASRIISALRNFGLHPLFVTPNKEIALLKAHTRSAILVHNKQRRATLTSLTWQQIEAHAKTIVGQA